MALPMTRKRRLKSTQARTQTEETLLYFPNQQPLKNTVFDQSILQPID